MIGDWEKDIKPIIDPIKEALAKSETFEEFAALLPTIMDQADFDRMAATLAEASLKSYADGMAGAV